MKLLTPEEVLQALKDGKKVEYLHIAEDTWYELDGNDFTVNNLLDNFYTYRLAQEMMTIGGVSFPKPECSKKVVEQVGVYYYPDILSPEDPYHVIWENSIKHFNILKSGLLHLNRENAIAHSKALIKLSGGSYE